MTHNRPPSIEDRLLAAEYAACMALCYASAMLGGGEPGGRERAAMQIKIMLAKMSDITADTRDNPGFTEALKTLMARFSLMIGTDD